MVNPHIDELSMMTYLSQYPDAKLKDGAPINKKKLKKPDPNKVKVYGPGLQEHGLDTNIPSADFTVDPRGAGDGKVAVNVTGPEGPVECVVEQKRNGTFNCSYVPTVEGDYTVNVEFGTYPVGKSPYKVSVTPGVDATACVAYGPGVEGTDLRASSPTEFWVETEGAGDGELVIVVRGPKVSIPSKDIVVKKESDDKYHAEYTPTQAGPHTIEVTFSGLHIRDSPFKVRVGSDRPDASKCRAEGPGVEGTDVEINKETWFDVHTKGAGRGDLSVNIKGPHGTIEAQRSEKERGVDHFTYTPTDGGEHVITVKFGGEQIPGSRFKVQVEPPTDASKCVAFGPGLAPQGVRVNDPAKFTVRTKDAGRGDVDVKITGPNGEVPFKVEESPYTYNYTYQASEPGDYSVDVTFAGEHIPNSPFPVAITDANKVKITGPGMNGECLPVNKPLVYAVDARGAGPGELKAIVQDRGSLKQTTDDQTDSASGPVVTSNGDGTYNVEYTPTGPGLKKMNVTFGETPIPNTPLPLNLFDPSQVKAYGPGLEDGNKSDEQTHFMVDMRTAGEGQFEVSVEGPANTPITIKDQANNIVKCEYTPSVPGDYTINVQYEGVHAPNSPFQVKVRPSTDSSAVKAYGPGLESGLTTDMWAEFFVDYKDAGDGEPQVKINGPGGGEKFEEEQAEDGLRKYRYYIDPDEAGDYKIEIDFADEPIPESPYNVHVNWKTDPSRVKAFGPGLEGGNVGEWTDFKLDMSQAGEGGLNIQIEGPCEAQVQVEEKDDGTATVKYLPEKEGEYKVNITFAEESIPGAPFTPLFVPETDATKVQAYGPGLQHDGVKVGDPGDFVIDTRAAGAGAVDVAIDGPYWRGREPTPTSHTPSPGAQQQPSVSPVGGERPRSSRSRSRGSMSAAAKPKITSNKDDTYDVVYNPRKVGTYKINVYFADQALPKSPFEVNICDPTKVVVTGPGVKDDDDTSDTVPVISVSNKEPLVWTVDCTEAGPGTLEAVLVGTDGKKDVQVTESEEDVYTVTYDAEKTGRHRLTLKYANNEVRQSPINFSLSDASRVKVSGAGLEGGRIGNEITVDLDTSEAGEGSLAISLAGPTQTNMTCDDHGDNKATLKFTPDTAGEYKLEVKFGDEDVPGSIFSIPIIDPSKCKASGSGVTGDGAKVGGPAEVIVDTRESGPAPVEATVTHPSGEKTTVELTPTDEEGVFSGEYLPKEPGHYDLEVKFADEELKDSPFRVPICDPSVVRLEGPGLEIAVKDVQNVIDVFTENAGPGEVGAEIESVNKNAPPVEVFVTEVDDNHYQVRYTPNDTSDVEVVVTYGGHPVEEKRTVPVCDTAKVIVDGPGVESGVLANKETHFTVDATEAGPSDLVVNVKDSEGEPIQTTITELEPRKWQVNYTPDKSGTHVVNVQYGTQDIQGSPFYVEVCDPDAVKAYGPGLEKATANQEAKFTIDASKAGEGSLGVNITGPSDCAIECKEVEDGMYEVSYVAPRPGVYAVDVKFADQEIPNNPFEVRCERPPPDASKCIVHGIEQPGSFTVDCRDAGGSGLLEVGVSGAYVPVEFVSVKHNGDYTFSISYDIPEPGETIISVKWHDQHLTGSPFTVVTK